MAFLARKERDPAGVETQLLCLEHDVLAPVADGLVLVFLVRDERNEGPAAPNEPEACDEVKGLGVVLQELDVEATLFRDSLHEGLQLAKNLWLDGFVQVLAHGVPRAQGFHIVHAIAFRSLGRDGLRTTIAYRDMIGFFARWSRLLILRMCGECGEGMSVRQDERTIVTVLVDNAEAEGLCSEWGLSLLVHTPKARVLLDFGQTDAFALNADALGADLREVDCAVLSHAHYDHADGMGAFFERNEHALLYLSDACAESCWSTGGGSAETHYIGIRPGLLARWADRLCFAPHDRVSSVAPGVHLVPHATPGLEDVGADAGMWLRDGDAWMPDSFAHELTLVVELGIAPDGDLLVLNSCSHAGIGVIVGEVRAAFPGRRIAAYVGGLHLFRADDKEVVEVARAVREAGIGQLWCGHCTGERAIELLRCELPGRISTLRPGLSFEVCTAQSL